MKKFLLATTATALLAPAASADGLAYHGSEIGGQIWYNVDGFGTFTNSSVWASTEFEFTGGDSLNGMFFQPQVSLYDLNFSITGASIGGHMGMMPTPSLDLGLFATYNFWFSGGTNDLIFGPEARGSAGPLEWESYLALFYNAGAGLYGGVGRADIWYDIGPKTTLHGGAGFLDTGGGLMPQFTVGARYDLTSSFKIEGTYTYTASGIDNHGFGINLTKTFDRGVTFGPRDYMTVRRGF